MANYQLELGRETIQLDSSKFLRDSPPAAWRGFNQLDLTILWRHYAQQFSFEQIAIDICPDRTQRVLAANYFRARCAEAKSIIKNANLNQSQLNGLPQMLINFI